MYFVHFVWVVNKGRNNTQSTAGVWLKEVPGYYVVRLEVRLPTHTTWGTADLLKHFHCESLCCPCNHFIRLLDLHNSKPWFRYLMLCMCGVHCWWPWVRGHNVGHVCIQVYEVDVRYITLILSVGMLDMNKNILALKRIVFIGLEKV